MYKVLESKDFFFFFLIPEFIVFPLAVLQNIAILYRSYL